MAIPWLDACLKARLPAKAGEPLKPMPTDQAWLAPLLGKKAVPAAKFPGDKKKAVWLPDAKTARQWMQFVEDTEVEDKTPPPAPTHLKIKDNVLTWKARADFESGLSHFIIERDGEKIGTVPERPGNRFGRPLFQGLQYSDTPAFPLVQMTFMDKGCRRRKETCLPGGGRQYGRIAVEIRKASPGRRTWPNSLWIFPRDTSLRSWQSCPSRFRIVQSVPTGQHDRVSKSVGQFLP